MNQKYRKLYELEDTEFTAKLIRRIVKLIMENQDKQFEEVKELLIGLAAVYGSQLVLKGNGRWEWQEGLVSHCWVKGIEGGHNTIPLDALAFCWKNKRDEATNVRELLHKFPKGPYGVVI